jgi:hypothetical protein
MNTTQTRNDDFSWVFSTPGPVILIIDFFINCYATFMQWGFTNIYTDKIYSALYRMHIFDHPQMERLVVVMIVSVGFILSTAPEKRAIGYRWPLIFTATGLVFIFGSGFLVPPDSGIDLTIARSYMFVYGSGYLMLIGGGARLVRALRTLPHRRFFNKDAGGFPQEERRIVTDRSLNFRSRYKYNGKRRKSWINIINPRRGVLLIGSSGCGKSRYIIEPAIEQMTSKGVSLFVYDFKYVRDVKLCK